MGKKPTGSTESCRRKLRQDRRKRIEKVSIEIENKLNNKDIIGAFNILRCWYTKFTGPAVKPAEMDINGTQETYLKLFTKGDLNEDDPLFDFDYDGDEVEDGVPEEKEIHRAVF